MLQTEKTKAKIQKCCMQIRRNTNYFQVIVNTLSLNLCVFVDLHVFS